MAALFFEMQANKFDAEALLRNFGMEKMKINRDKIHRDKIHFFPKRTGTNPMQAAQRSQAEFSRVARSIPDNLPGPAHSCQAVSLGNNQMARHNLPGPTHSCQALLLTRG